VKLLVGCIKEGIAIIPEDHRGDFMNELLKDLHTLQVGDITLLAPIRLSDNPDKV
jgi:hypothetical protein